jgi:dTDP-4-dehydrorhamnose 3,5-epimerase
MTSRFRARETRLSGLTLLERTKVGDDRGFLSRLFCAEDLTDFGFDAPVSQINETGTRKAGTVRGMHYQRTPFAEIKLVTCVEGRVLDIAVDVRRGSPTWLQHYAVELSADNACSLLIPKGFAHGFQALSDYVRMIYVHSAPYHAESEGGLHCLDSALGLNWPLPVRNLSDRDNRHPLVSPSFEGVDA